MKLAAIVLAAGSARRFGGNKLLADFQGQPLLNHAIRAARAAPVGRVVVVCPPSFTLPPGEDLPPVETLRVTSDALSTSLKAGVAAVAGADGAFIFLGDMPLIPHGAARALASRLDGNFAAVPRFGRHNGHPVLLSRRAFAEIATLSGDAGAGKLLAGRNDIAFLDCACEGITLDIDRKEDLARLSRRAARRG